MRFASAILLVCILVSQAALFAQTTAEPSAPVVPSSVERPLAFGLHDGTPVRLRISRNLSSADAKTGETVDFEVLEDIRVGEVVVIPRGSVAIGTVTRAKPKGRLGKAGKLDLAIDHVRTIVGEKVALRGTKENKGGSTTAAMTGAIVASSILFFPAAPFFLFMKGKETKIPKGTEVSAYVSGNTELDAGRYTAAHNIFDGQLPTNSVGLVSVVIKSEPEGADITVGGSFVGNTPSTIYLKSGEHTITITKPGFKKWERFIRLTAGGNITVNATLEPGR